MSARIHPTAIVHSGAVLADDCVVGPYCIVGDAVTIGAQTELIAHVVVDGPTTLGAQNVVHPFARLGGPPQDLKYRGEPTQLVVGDRNTIRECVTFSRATPATGVTIVGSDNLFMSYVHVAHDARFGSHVVVANSVQMAGHVEVGDRVVLGGGTLIHQFVHIGAYSIVGAGTRAMNDVIPYMRAVGAPPRCIGLNTIGLQRNGFAPEARARIKAAYKLLYLRGLNTSQALERLRADFAGVEEVERIVAFIERSKRGIIPGVALGARVEE